MTLLEDLEESAAAWGLLAYQAEAQKDNPVVVEGRCKMAARLREHAARLRSALASVHGSWDLSDENIARGPLLKHINGAK